MILFRAREALHAHPSNMDSDLAAHEAFKGSGVRCTYALYRSSAVIGSFVEAILEFTHDLGSDNSNPLMTRNVKILSHPL